MSDYSIADYSRFRRLRVITMTSILVDLSFIFYALFLPSEIVEIEPLHMIRLILGVLIMIPIPGYLLFSVLGLEIRCHMSKYVLIIGLGVFYTMIIGLAIVLLGQISFLDTIGLYDLPLPLVFSQLALGIYLLWRSKSEIESSDWPSSDDDANRVSLLARPAGIMILMSVISIACVESFDSSGDGAFQISSLMLAFSFVAIAYMLDNPSYAFFSILALSVALLVFRSLLTDYVVGFDVNHELYVARLVLQDGHWDTSLPLNTNAAASITIFLPSAAILTNVSEVYIAKTVIPLLFSLVPPSIYLLLRRFIGIRMAMISALIIAAQFVFFTEMVGLLRQMIAEMFLVLFILIVSLRESWGTSPHTRNIMALMFLFGVIISHYATAVLVGFVVSTAAVLSLISFSKKQGSHQTSFAQIGGIWRIIALYWVMLLFWYSSFSSGSFIEALALTGQRLFDDFVSLSTGTYESDPYVTSTIGSIGQSLDALRTIFLLQVYVLFGIILLGAATSILLKTREDFGLIGRISFGAFVILASALFLPILSSTLNGSRIIHLSLLFISFWFAVGSLRIADILFRVRSYVEKLYPIRNSLSNSHTSVKSILYASMFCFIFVFLLFNTGIAYYIAGDSQSSISLNQDIDYPRFDSEDVIGAEFVGWLEDSNDYRITADIYAYILLMGYTSNASGAYYSEETQNEYDLFFIRSANLDGSFILFDVITDSPIRLNETESEYFLDYLLSFNQGMIFSDGSCVILLSENR